MDKLYKIKPLDWVEHEGILTAYSALRNFEIFVNFLGQWRLNDEENSTIVESKEAGIKLAEQIYLDQLENNLIEIDN